MQMTGKDLIVYILKYDLENEVVFDDGIFSKLFYTSDELAAKLGVGIATIRSWYMLDMIPGFSMNNGIYFPRNIEDPRIAMNKTNQGADCNG